MKYRLLILMLIINDLDVASTSSCNTEISPLESGYCTQSTSCCTKEEQKNLVESSRSLLQQKIEDRVISLRYFLHSSYASFRTFFFSIISENESNMDDVFTETYGTFYRENSQIFHNFYSKLKTFASGNSETSIHRITQTFFDQLFRVLYTLSNPLMRLESEDLACLQMFAYETRPFAELEKRIIKQLEVPLTFWREFLSALDTGHQILNEMQTITVKQECVNAMARMQMCAYCNNIGERPCKKYCLNVLSGCSYAFGNVQKYWNNAKGAMVKLATSLKEKQNVVSAMYPIPMFISEAVMYFQENHDFINNQLVSKCFFERNRFFYRKKRSYQYHSTSFEKNQKSRILEHMKQLIAAFVHRIEKEEILFDNFHEDYCKDEVDDNVNQCWNGTAVGTYDLPLTVNMNPIYNPEYQNKNFITFQGSFVEERLRLQWLEQRIFRILSKNDDKREKRLDESSFNNDDEDYDDDKREASGSLLKDETVRVETIPMKLLPKHTTLLFSNQICYLLSFLLVFYIY